MGSVLGGASYKKWRNRKRLTRQELINAHCYNCNGASESGEDCRGEKSCPLYPYSPSAQRRGYKDGVVPSQNNEMRGFDEPS